MPAPATIPEFLELVRKSGVAEDSRTHPYFQKLTDAGELPSEPSKFAGLMVRDGLLTYFQAEQLLQGKWKRFFIGKYKVLEKIGVGGMGQVFLCEHKLMRRRVAVKVLPTAKAAELASLDRFYREARAVAALDHPNIVRAYDIDQDDNLHFLVMEFVDGSNLQDLVKKAGPLDVSRACHYAYGAAVGLQYAFEMGIVHRDIKPGNILVDRTGVVKILDMGLARFFNDEDDQLTRMNDENVLGTADYLAPEQAVDSHTVDIRADIYSLGGTFYYMLTGSSPFPEGSVAQKLLWHQTREPRGIATLRPEVPEDLVAIVAKMMAKDANARYATPAELLVSLAAWVQTPIAPPAEREMPQLSPAAAGPSATGLGARPAFAVSPLGVALSSSGTNGLPVVKTVEAPPQDPPPGVWDSLGDEMRVAGTGETKPGVAPNTKPAASARKLAVPALPRRRRGRWMLVGLVGVVALGGAVAAGLQFFGSSEATPSRGITPDSKKRFVSASGGTTPADRTYASLAKALAKVAAGETIVLLDDLLEEGAIQITGSARLKDLTIEPAPGKVVRWVPPAPQGNVHALLELRSIEGLTIRGVQIDLRGYYEIGIHALGVSPGLTLDDVEIRAPRGEAVRLAVAGDAARPVTLSRVRVAAGEPMETGIVFAGKDRLATRHAIVTQSRIVGPARAGIRIDGLATDVQISQTRVFNVENGILFAGDAPADAMKVRVEQNTFFNLRSAGIRHDAAWPGNKLHEVILARNLFAKSNEAAVGRDGKFPGLLGTNNARATDTRDGNVKLDAMDVGKVEFPTDAGDDAAFLRYDKNSPLNAAGPAKLPVGVPPP